MLQARGRRFTSRADAIASARRTYICLRCGSHGPVDRDGTAWLPECACAHDHGVCCDSQIELGRASELVREQRLGHISALKAHPRFSLRINDQDVGVYEADFGYVRDQRAVLEEVKPKMRGGWEKRDPLAALKIAVFRALYPMQPLTILER